MKQAALLACNQCECKFIIKTEVDCFQQQTARDLRLPMNYGNRRLLPAASFCAVTKGIAPALLYVYAMLQSFSPRTGVITLFSFRSDPEDPMRVNQVDAKLVCHLPEAAFPVVDRHGSPIASGLWKRKIA